MKKILVPITNQQAIKEPLKEVVSFAKGFDAEVTLFHVVDLHKIPNEVVYGAYIEKIYETANKDNFMDNVIKLYEKEGIKVKSEIREGDAATQIVEEGEKGNYDLIIIETHSMKERSRFLLGSVTNKVVHHSKIPVLVLR